MKLVNVAYNRRATAFNYANALVSYNDFNTVNNSLPVNTMLSRIQQHIEFSIRSREYAYMR